MENKKHNGALAVNGICLLCSLKDATDSNVPHLYYGTATTSIFNSYDLCPACKKEFGRIECEAKVKDIMFYLKHGAKKDMSTNSHDICCPVCKNLYNTDANSLCPFCGGYYLVKPRCCECGGQRTAIYNNTCYGPGLRLPCLKCGGKGWIEEKKVIKCGLCREPVELCDCRNRKLKLVKQSKEDFTLENMLWDFNRNVYVARQEENNRQVVEAENEAVEKAKNMISAWITDSYKEWTHSRKGTFYNYLQDKIRGNK